MQICRAAKKLGYKSYRVRKVCKLTDRHKGLRKLLCHEFLTRDDREELLKKIAFSDECSFKIGSAYVNSTHTNYLGKGPIRNLANELESFYEKYGQQTQSGERLMVFGAVCYGKPVYLDFFEPSRETGVMSVNQDTYQDMVGDFFTGSWFDCQNNIFMQKHTSIPQKNI